MEKRDYCCLNDAEYYDLTVLLPVHEIHWTERAAHWLLLSAIHLETEQEWKTRLRTLSVIVALGRYQLNNPV